MKRLLAYSLESLQDTGSYSVHPVVRDRCIEFISRRKIDLMRLALMIVGLAVPGQSEPEY